MANLSGSVDTEKSKQIKSGVSNDPPEEQSEFEAASLSQISGLRSGEKLQKGRMNEKRSGKG